LPNLPDRLSDPNQASIAAHCVHQIRTILQIHHAVPLSGSDGATEEPRSFAVTSAGRGEGKTSLALALGLSYAASGCRTLLVDTDLRSGGLSRRLDVQGDEGILDALLGGDLLQATCETEVANLAVLPIGNAKGSRAGVFSPVAVRQMLRQAKRNFDVILLDCGPILGSIEATPVASAADATILCITRGQAKPMVSKAAKHLGHVGGVVAGLVYNRAGSADFERSVAGMNYRDASRERQPTTTKRSGTSARRTPSRAA
ncbi:MAG: CpsD/CapB family tyrosine-protein kinase, partial [Planctomycetota bacterium]